MKRLLLTYLFLAGELCFANMASPVQEGTFSSAAFSSRNIHILAEKIHVTPDELFKTAFFNIEYKIRTDSGGNQIPLLFHAIDYSGDFRVWVDDQVIAVSPVPAAYRSIGNSPFRDFSDIFQNGDHVTIYWDEYEAYGYEMDDLKYFETPLTKREHSIRIEYTATVWTDLDKWIKNYSFRYSLSPARFWRSFGTLEIILDARKFKGSVTTNFGNPISGKPDSVSVWIFNELPGDYLKINYTPEISPTATTLLNAGTDQLTLYFALTLVILHVVLLLLFRKKNPRKKYSWPLITGSILVPFAILCFNLYSYEIIDRAIGAEASRYHGYIFLIMILYPVFMPLYWLGMWLIDRFYRKKISAG